MQVKTEVTQVQSQSDRREIVELLYSNIFNGMMMTVLAISGLVFGFGFDTKDPTDPKLMHWVAMMIIVVVRLIDALYWQSRLHGRKYDPRAPFIRFSVGVLSTCVVWASYSILLFTQFSELELASTIVVLSAMAGGAASVLSPSRFVVLSYCSMLLLPMSVMIVTFSERPILVIGYLGFAFWVTMVFTSNRANRFYIRALGLKNQNQRLLQQMQVERNDAVKMREELLATNTKLDNANANLEAEVLRRTDDIHRLSNRDPLTSLMNRSGFTRHLESLISTTKRLENRLAVLFIDLDGFKQVNDSLGHQVGDSVLEEVSKRLTRFCEPDHLARWGGDEFVIALPYANEDTAIAVAHAARSGITIPINVRENQITLDATIGIALFPEHGMNAQSLIQEADLTMYEQKRTQRGSVGVFNQEIYTALREEQSLREGLRSAIDNGELSVVYQPIIRGDEDKLWGVEALLRWNFNGKPVGPNIFIPLAEKSGLIYDIGTWVLHRACIDAAQWPFDNDVAVSVNVSVIQLMDDGFIKSLDRVLSSSGLDPSRLHLEITESVFADNKEKVIRQVNAIKARQVQISIDDFGTGFSSLSQLQSLSFDHIKIDRAFVQNLEEGSDTIIRATLLIAKEFGCMTIAEGIETPEHAQRLKAMGVDCLQGYYYARPLLIRDLLNWYAER